MTIDKFTVTDEGWKIDVLEETYGAMGHSFQELAETLAILINKYGN